MFGHQGRLIAFDDGCQAIQVIGIERLSASQRQPNAMHRYRIMLTKGGETPMGWAAGPHVIFGMDFEKGQRGKHRQDLIAVLRFETDSSGGGGGHDCHDDASSLFY
jgi:hypothetical protein